MRTTSRLVFALLLCLVVGVVLVAVSRFSARSVMEAGRLSTVSSLHPSAQNASDSPLAAPAPVDPTWETVVITMPPDGEMLMGIPGKIVAVATPTIPPTPTPWPTPTLRPGPTATALSLPKPAPHAAGALYCFVRTKFEIGGVASVTEGIVLRAGIDAAGAASSTVQEADLGRARSFPSWDRSRVAFVNRTMGGDRITVLNTSTGTITPVETSWEHFGYFAGWHPNNQELLYLVGDSSNGGLWRIDIETGERTIVAQQDPLYIFDAAISPDGQRIVYAQQKGWQAPVEVWSVFADGSEPKLLIADDPVIGLSWSPDGKSLAYLGSQGLTVRTLESGASRVVAKGARADGLSKPAWSPDGRYLAFTAYEPDLIPPSLLEQGPKRRVLDSDEEAFVGSNVHLVDLETGEERPLAPLKPAATITGFTDPVWSPDGTMLAMAGMQAGQMGIWTVNVDGTNLRHAIDEKTLVRFPAWTTASQ